MYILIRAISSHANGGPRMLTLWFGPPPPHQHEKNFSGASVCRVSFKHIPYPLRSHIQNFGTLGQLLKIPPFFAHSADVGWILSIVVSPCKISEPYDNF